MVAAVWAGCSPDASTPLPGTSTVTDSAGVRVVDLGDAPAIRRDSDEKPVGVALGRSGFPRRNLNRLLRTEETQFRQTPFENDHLATCEAGNPIQLGKQLGSL